MSLFSLRTTVCPRGPRDAYLAGNWRSKTRSISVHRRAAVRRARRPGDRNVQLLGELLAYPDVPRAFHQPQPSIALLPLVPVTFVKAGQRFDFFSTVTTLGTPQDITVQEIRIECFFPTDTATEAAARNLAAQRS